MGIRIRSITPRTRGPWHACVDAYGLYITSSIGMESQHFLIAPHNPRPETPYMHTSLVAVALPQELYGAIISNLYHENDRLTLLSTSLASSILRDESQPVLFRATTGRHFEYRDGPLSEDRLVNTSQTFYMFLTSVVSHPNRLAKYVRTYRCPSQVLAAGVLGKPRMFQSISFVAIELASNSCNLCRSNCQSHTSRTHGNDQLEAPIYRKRWISGPRA